LKLRVGYSGPKGWIDLPASLMAAAERYPDEEATLRFYGVGLRCYTAEQFQQTKAARAEAPGKLNAAHQPGIFADIHCFREKLRRESGTATPQRLEWLANAIVRLTAALGRIDVLGEEPASDNGPLADFLIDARALIRESRTYESTAGPPGTFPLNAKGPGYSQGQRHSSLAGYLDVVILDAVELSLTSLGVATRFSGNASARPRRGLRQARAPPLPARKEIAPAGSRPTGAEGTVLPSILRSGSLPSIVRSGSDGPCSCL
jgi:hypothetical protein